MSTLAVAQNTPSAPASQNQPQGQPTQPGEEPAAAAPAPPAYAPSTDGSGSINRAVGPIRVSGGVMAAQNITRVAPVYPPDAKAAGVQGAVVLTVTVGKAGTITALQPISGPPTLCDAAVAAVRQWTYRPYMLNGQPVAVNTVVTVNFQLPSSAPPGQ